METFNCPEAKNSDEPLYDRLIDLAVDHDLERFLDALGMNELSGRIGNIKVDGDPQIMESLQKIITGNSVTIPKDTNSRIRFIGVTIDSESSPAKAIFKVQILKVKQETVRFSVLSNKQLRKDKTIHLNEYKKNDEIEVVFDLNGDSEDILHFLIDGQEVKQKNFSDETIDFNVKGVSFKMVRVEHGSFMMGAVNSNLDERPMHRVTLTSDYYIGETQVTQALWEAVMGDNPSYSEGDDPLEILREIVGGSSNSSYFRGGDLPVESVSWDVCQEFIKKLNQKLSKQLAGWRFELPTEAEWEYAARGGNKSNGFEFAGSNNIDYVAWYKGNSNSHTHPVKTKRPNVLGLYDMSGNVMEWCSDWHNDVYYHVSPSSNPPGPNWGKERVLRGGSFANDSKFCRISCRAHNFPDYREKFIGFRLVLVL